jgi:quinol monooxygenase YgiN
MNSMPIQVVAHITARPDKVEETRAVCTGLIAATRREAGCIRYQLYQNNADPTDFTFVEEWESDAALDAHMQTPHVAAAIARAAEILAAPPDIRRYSLVG